MRSIRWILAVATVMTLSSCGKEAARERPAENVLQVGIGSVQKRDLSQVIVLPATLEPEILAEIGIKTAGRVLAVEVSEGEMVKAGAVLARLASVSLTHQANQAFSVAEAAAAEVERAEAEMLQRERDYGRSLRLHGEGVVSAESIEKSRSALEISVAAHHHAKRRAAADRDAARALAADAAELTLRSSIAGEVSRRGIEPGQVVAPGSIAFRVVRIDRLKVVAHIPEKSVNLVRAGQPVEVGISADGQSAEGRITSVVHELDPRTRMARVEALIGNDQRRYAPGMRAELRIMAGTLADATAVPAEAVVARDDRNFVYVVSDSKAFVRSIDIAFRADDWIAVDSGLMPGELIVTSQLAGLRDGTTVAAARRTGGPR